MVFGINFKKKKSYRPRQKMTPVEISRRKAEKKFEEIAKKDPRYNDYYIRAHLGIEKPPDPDPFDQSISNIGNVMIRKVEESFGDGDEIPPEYYDGIMEAVLGRIAVKSGGKRGRPPYYGGGGTRNAYGEEEYGRQSPLAQAIQTADELEALKERFGNGRGGGGGLFGNISPEQIQALGGLLSGLFGIGSKQSQGQLPPPTYYIVEVDGKQARVSDEKYRQLLAEGRIKPVGTLLNPPEEKPKVKPVEESEGNELGIPEKTTVGATLGAIKEEIKEVVIDEVEVVPSGLPDGWEKWAAILDIKAIAAGLSEDPEDFANALIAKAGTGDSPSILLANALVTMESDTVFRYLEALKDKEEYSAYATDLLTDEGREWVETVMETIAAIGQNQVPPEYEDQ